jgi:hypothetical protein
VPIGLFADTCPFATYRRGLRLWAGEGPWAFTGHLHHYLKVLYEARLVWCRVVPVRVKTLSSALAERNTLAAAAR